MQKNKRVIILVGVLIGVIGISLAYFVGRMLSEGSGASVKVTTADLKNSKVEVRGTLDFDYEGMLPGHKEVSGIEVIATGNNELIPYNLVWKGSNNLNTNLNFTVYRVSEEMEVEASCKEIKEKVLGGTMLYETCEISNIELLGEAIKEGVIPSSSEDIKVELASDEFITSTITGEKIYYYVIMEYPNEEETQNEDMGKGFKGEVTVEASDIEPDVNIMAAYIEQEDGTYKEIKEGLPKEGYTINSKMSHCSNDAIPSWDSRNKGLLITDLTQSGTECYLYYDTIKSGTIILADNPIPTKLTEEFNGPSCDSNSTSTDGCGVNNMSQNGLYESEDDDGTTYYFRGSVTNNYVKFGKTGNEKGIGEDMYWRIIRINGDGSIRLIYEGTTAHANGDASNTDSVVFTNQHWNIQEQSVADDNKYVGLTWSDEQVRGYTTKSNVLKQLETWYTANLTDEADLIDTDTGFCNDRQPSNKANEINNQGGTLNTTTYYGAFIRIASQGSSTGTSKQTPTFKCSEKTNKKDEDLYTMSGASKGNKKLTFPIGLISADEVSFAGGYHGANNYKYYLFNGQNYWTMSPYYFNGGYADVFSVISSNLGYSYVGTANVGVRPVINLKANIKFTTLNNEYANGTINNPYIVE